MLCSRVDGIVTKTLPENGVGGGSQESSRGSKVLWVGSRSGVVLDDGVVWDRDLGWCGV